MYQAMHNKAPGCGNMDRHMLNCIIYARVIQGVPKVLDMELLLTINGADRAVFVLQFLILWTKAPVQLNIPKNLSNRIFEDP